MLMMCWFYCVPFAKGLFFAIGPLLIIFAAFMLKRGVRQWRPGLRQAAFWLVFAVLVKMFTIDLHLLRDTLLCGGPLGKACTNRSFQFLQFGGLVILATLSVALFNYYRSFVRERAQVRLTLQQAKVRFWANMSLTLVVILTSWLSAPWLGYLTVGHVPKVFMSVPWQWLALFTAGALLTGFWRYEDCFLPTEKGQRAYASRVWTPKDTLWMSVFLFLISLALSYASNDVLRAH